VEFNLSKEIQELTANVRRRFVTAEAAVATFKTAPAIDAARFRADLDAWAGQDPLPRA
jgi:hypothetical protein